MWRKNSTVIPGGWRGWVFLEVFFFWPPLTSFHTEQCLSHRLKFVFWIFRFTRPRAGLRPAGPRCIVGRVQFARVQCTQYTSHASLRAYGAQLGGDSSSSEDLQNIFDMIFQTGPVDNHIDTFEQYLKFQYTSFTSFTSYPPRINQTLTPPHHISNAPSQNH